MSSWIDTYKKWVISSHKRHIMVADKDGLLEYAELRQTFEGEGYILLHCESDLDVRLAFELYVRDSAEPYLMTVPATYYPLPDIEMLVHFQAIGLAQLFPNYDPKAIKGLSNHTLRLLFNNKLHEDLSYEQTLIFVLEQVYGVDFDRLTSINAKERVLSALITVLFEKEDINEPLAQFMIRISRPYFPALTQQGLNKHDLVTFIQEQWNAYVEGNPDSLDFKEPALSKSIGYLFAFEYMLPVQVSSETYNALPKSLRIGVYVDKQRQNDQELEGQTDYLRQQIDIIEDIPDQWFNIIQVLASAKLKYGQSGNEALKITYQQTENALNDRFQRFIDNTYDSLFSLSGVRKPVVVSRILEHIKASPARKKALIVIDGMNYWQWILLGRALAKTDIRYSSTASLAYIPTITAWSRQAIFRGGKPDMALDNSQEARLFESYWLKYGVLSYQIRYQKFGLHDPLIIKSISPDTTILGLVCNDLDDIMHGSVLGNSQLIMSTEQWIIKSEIVITILALISLGFELYITSDHGNVEATGLKNLTLKDKVGVVNRSKRHLYFTNEMLMESFLMQNTDLKVGQKGLSVYLKDQDAFTIESNQVVTHGGSHLWEVIVPFIHIYGQ
ncbi:MAG: BREX-3 system phosphatase PglZ [Bacteroidia bacterium]|nr:BREX-3 system phosphatase PglZ [Bacteroidia bacterium]